MSDQYEQPAQEAPPAKPEKQHAALIVTVLSILISFCGILVIIFVDMTTEKLAIVSGFVGVMLAWGSNGVQFHLGSNQGAQAQNNATANALGRLTR